MLRMLDWSGKDETCEQVKKLLKKYPDRIPVICTKAAKTSLPEIEKKKFLVPATMLCGEFKFIIHKHIAATGSPKESMGPDQTLYLLMNNSKKSVKASQFMSEVYAAHKAKDGYLYIHYSAEATLG
mmetsp:Transcript_2619/g.4566  ORF Transcript_2619/g.4566 Transcript_2619/m.4566 type:complete len:126 (+) Transcript_2619:84-461(+)